MAPSLDRFLERTLRYSSSHEREVRDAICGGIWPENAFRER
jgi:hypothetical protein